MSRTSRLTPREEQELLRRVEEANRRGDKKELEQLRAYILANTDEDTQKSIGQKILRR